jgi:tight adherence protein B
MTLGMLAVLVFLAVTTGVVAVYMLIVGRSQAAREKTIEHRLSELGTAAGAANNDAEGGDSSLVRKQSTGALPGVERMAKSALKGSSFERWLEQSGMALSLSGCVLISLALGAAGAFGALLVSHRAWVMPVGFAIGLCLLPALVRRRRTKRLDKFEEHFPEALDLLSRGIRAGHAFSAGMKMVADELPEPVGPEFKKAFEEQNYGLPLKESLNNLALRIPLLDVRFFSTAVLIQRETGGNLSEILDTLSNVVRERFKIRRQVRVHTAHGRFTGWVLMALPAFLAIALSFINPDHMKLLFEDRLGQMMVIASVVMQAVGFLWIKKVIKIEV